MQDARPADQILVEVVGRKPRTRVAVPVIRHSGHVGAAPFFEHERCLCGWVHDACRNIDPFCSQGGQDHLAELVRAHSAGPRSATAEPADPDGYVGLGARRREAQALHVAESPDAWRGQERHCLAQRDQVAHRLAPALMVATSFLALIASSFRSPPRRESPRSWPPMPTAKAPAAR